MQKDPAVIFKNILKACSLCPHQCLVDRQKGQLGFCVSGNTAKISKAMPHFGEEPPISAKKGSGTIFFANCNMNCCYCQNFQISQQGSIKYTKEITDAQLADIMIDLMQSGCHNINLVSPTIWVANIVPAIHLAKNMGLNIPIVYNCGGYENIQTIKMLEGIIDIYMPDMRYADDDAAFAFSNVKDYVENNRKSVIEMFRQVNTLKTGPGGAATKGLLIRLLVLPNNISNTKDSILFIANELSNRVTLSIMSQYRPVYLAHKHEKINRSLYYEEYMAVVDYAKEMGFEDAYIQDCIGLKEDPYFPDFNNKDIFGQKD